MGRDFTESVKTDILKQTGNYVRYQKQRKYKAYEKIKQAPADCPKAERR